MRIARVMWLGGVLVLGGCTAWGQPPSSGKPEEVGCPSPVKFRSESIHARDSVYKHPDGYTKDGFSMEGVTLRSVFELVFSTERIEGLPDWAQKQTYDAIAEIDPDDCCRWANESSKEKALAVQGFLQEKLKLKWHTETRMVKGYELMVEKKGPKFVAAAPDAKGMDEPIQSGWGLAQLNGRPIPMGELAAFLSGPGEAGRPVVDKTGLAGRYVLSGKYTCCRNPDSWGGNLIEADGTPVQPPPPPTFFDDLDVLGLELKGAKVPVEVLVIDGIERPDQN